MPPSPAAQPRARPLAKAQAAYDNIYNQLQGYQQQLDAGKRQMYKQGLISSPNLSNDQLVTEAKAALRKMKLQLLQGQLQLTTGTASAYTQFDAAQKQLEEGWAEYNAGQTQLEESRTEYESQKAEAEQKLADGLAQLNDAEEQVSQIKKGEWYVLDRSSTVSFVTFEQYADRMDAIARVFPVFFFLVAALVATTTMTRMVDENRLQLGTLKALGYSNAKIAGKYLFYALSASVLGSIVGMVIGFVVFPLIIWYAYQMIFSMSTFTLHFYPGMAAASVAISAAVIGFATWNACRASLKEKTAALLLPRAPVAGKRILMERITPLWSRMSFSQKTTARNLFRYKKRFFMTVLGVAGCTALLLIGFGIQDSISSVVDYQYDEITRYDAAVTFQHALSGSEREDFLAVCEESSAGGCLFVAEKSLDASKGSTVKTTNVVCPESGSVDGFIDLHTQEKTPIPYPQDGGCIISRGLAQALRLSAGDTITLQTGDMRRTELTVEAVFENYVYNYVYLTQTTWQDVFGEAPGYEAAWVNYQTDEDAQAASAALAGAKNAAAVTLSRDFRSRVATMMQSLRYIVLVVVLGAAALAFIVLYNLTNINITER